MQRDLLNAARALVFLLLVHTAAAAWAQCAAGSDYQQSAAVKRRYPDPAVRFETPAFAPGKTGYTAHAEMMTFLERLARQSRNMQVRVAGHSQEGRAIPVLLFSNSGRFGAAELKALERPVVLLVGQLHGNEPAGGEAMLALAQSLAAGELRPLLDRVSVVIMPRGNPDGAHYFWRSTANCVDVNRDHLKVDLPETLAIRRTTSEFQPDIFVDAHEFSVATRWIEKFNALQSYDFTMAYATHPNIEPSLNEVAERLFSRNIARDVERAGYTHFWYYTTAYNLKDLSVAGGGTAPDIGRNYAGLQNMLSFLVETRGVGIGRDSYARRVHTHYVVMASLLRTAADNAAEVRKTVQSAREQVVRKGRSAAPDDLVAVTLKMPKRPQKLTMIDPATGDPKEVEVEWVDPREAQAGLSRARPWAYLLLPSLAEVARRLALSGIEVRRLQTPTELEVESYDVTERRAGTVFVEGHIRSTVTTELKARKRLFPAGTFVYTLAQPGANILVAALEPESASSFVSLGMIATDRRGLANPQEAAPSEVPVFRLMRPAALELGSVKNP
ncbi:MAG TPA: M14 family metallopeptidase [Burkholderiales bacterium]|nr:M14 family metallopeptidase [Burkholderiales bacterium]